MERLILDTRHALRGLLRQKGLVLGAVAALALGIGATTTMFSIVHGGTRGLPFDDAHELVVLTSTRPGAGLQDLLPTVADYLAWTQQQRSFEGLGAFSDPTFNLSGPESRPERRSGALLSPNTFALLGVRPALGRDLTPLDAQPGAEPVVILSHELWQARYGGDRAIIGKLIRVDGEPRAVIGVMPPRFGFPVSARLWLPLIADSTINPADRVRVFGRLRDQAALESARAELAVIARRLQQADPAAHADLGTRIFPFIEIEMDTTINAFLYLMLGAVSFVLLIACANVTNLLLARAATRTREVAIRAALGAGRMRIVMTHLIESAMIALAGGALGLLGAHAGVSYFGRATADILEAFWIEFRVDPVVLTFAIAATSVAALAAGLMPALRASRTQPGAVLKDESHGSSSLRLGRFSRALVVAQVALACGLLVMASVFVQTAISLRQIELPFDTRRVLTAQLGATSRMQDSMARPAFLRQLVDRLAGLPGVTAVATMSTLPGRGAGEVGFARDGEAGLPELQKPRAGLVVVTPGFLAVLEARVIRGRDLSWRDDSRAPGAMLVNQSWVTRFSSDRDPLGRQVAVGPRSYTVVGIVPDLQMEDLDERNAHGMYVSALQAWPTNVRLVLRSGGEPRALLGPVMDAIGSIDADLPLFEALPLEEAIYSDYKVLDALAWLFFAFGLGALVLTTTGLYGVVAFGVSSRTRELGIRMALGARRADIIRMVLRQGARQLLLGFAIGGTLAYALGRAAANALELIDGVDPRAFVAVIAALAFTGLAALFTPARRAAAVQPLVALRHE